MPLSVDDAFVSREIGRTVESPSIRLARAEFRFMAPRVSAFHGHCLFDVSTDVERDPTLHALETLL
ncbi:MAG TPA: hypothetical protein VGL17_13920 [Gemmatimonadaceae bacterium]